MSLLSSAAQTHGPELVSVTEQRRTDGYSVAANINLVPVRKGYSRVVVCLPRAVGAVGDEYDRRLVLVPQLAII